MTAPGREDVVQIPFLDLKSLNASLEPRLSERIKHVVDSGWYIGGHVVEEFEREFAAYCSVKHCVGVSNGLDALRLILQGLEIGEGDEVIVPSHTFIATWLAVSAVGAKPVPVAPDTRSMNLDPTLVEAAISPRTRAIIPVHLYGLPVEMGEISDIADRHSVDIIEDAAQAHGARFKDRRVGGFGRAAAFSFYPAKNLGALGDAGAVTTNDASLARRIRMLANYGSEEKYQHELRGVNCRLDPIQAAVLSAKLQVLDEWNSRRQTVALKYSELLSGIKGLQLPEGHSEAVWHLYVVRTQERDALQKSLASAGIQTQVHYPIAPARQPAYASMPGVERCAKADTISATALSLPMGPHLNEAQVGYVARQVLNAQSNRR